MFIFILFVFLFILQAEALTTSPTSSTLFDDFCSSIDGHQDAIIGAICEHETAEFSRDPWQSGKASGLTRVISDGVMIEKGAVSKSIIRDAPLSVERAATISSRTGRTFSPGSTYSAAALSLVLHTRSPLVPTFRSDVRAFSVDGDTWFGGGADLTPYYLYDDEIQAFHQTMKELCEAHGQDYLSHKKSCDEYFYLPSREEHRGTGGIFFDDVAATRESLAFVDGLCKAWMPSWLGPMCLKRKDEPYSEEQKDWQLIRRGRYLEFNLLYDRGVKFGLAGANPRVEGVLVSAPPLVRWVYNHEVQKGSEEERLMEVLKKPKDWAV
mmetsp:Transcript_19795/g.39587  ORF Transcript_19795/g.39587 Transcript_19795/m.39587 type:complete len:324 (+) Transcript_19795:114-1085(+)